MHGSTPLRISLAKPSLYSLLVPEHISQLVRAMHPELKKKVRAALEIILSDPSSGKGLKSELSGLRSYRIGSFRIIYRVADRVVELVAIGPRKQIYAETYRLLRKSK
jgi:mRNA interferase RelE/StbE